MNDEFPRRPADDDPDPQPDYGFGGGPLFRDEVPPAGRPGYGGGSVTGPAAGLGAGPGAVSNPGSTGFHDASMFRGPAGSAGAPEDVRGLDYGSGGDYGTGILSGVGGGADSFSHAGPNAFSGGAGAGAAPGVPGAPGSPGAPGAVPDAPGAGPQWGAHEGPLRVVPAEQASALLRIKLPESPPVPSTTLRGDAPIGDVVEASQMLHRVSPAKPNALPGDVLALTTATMVVPMPGAAFGARTPQRPARLTASVPPDLASRAEADLLSDTVEQFFGDFDAIGRELQAQRAGASAGVASGVGSPVGPGVGPVPTGPAHSGAAGAAEVSQPPMMPGQYAPSAPPAGRYGVPTQFPGYDAARRSPVGMRYLGGIFHDSSGESSFYDPSTESLVPMGAAAISASDFRRTAPAITRPVPSPRTSPRGAASPRAGTAPAPAPTGTRTSAHGGRPGSSSDPGGDETKVLSRERRSDHHADRHTDRHADHHRRGRRRGRVALVSALSVTLAFGTVYGAALAFEGQVPKGTVVDGVAIGGLSRTAAEAKLSAALGPRLNAPIRLTADGTMFQLAPAQAGLDIDYAGTVVAAAARRTDPTVAIPALAGSGRDVALRVSVDRAVLKAALTNLTAGFDKPMVDGSVVFPGGVPTPIAPRPGREVDVDAAVDAVVSAFDDGVAAAHGAAMGSGGSLGGSSGGVPGGSLPTAPVAYGLAPAKTALSPSRHVAAVREKQPSATPSTMPSPTPSPTPSGTDSPGGAVPPMVVPAGSASASVPSPASVPAPAPSPAAAGGSFPAAPVVLTVHDVQPTVTPAAVAQAMQDFARPAMSGPVTVVTGSVKTVLKPAVVGRHLAVEPDGRGGLVPKLDGAGIRAELDHDALAKLEQPPTDASFTVAKGQPVLVPGKNGVGYAPAAIQTAMLAVLTKTSSAQRVATVPIGPLPPAFTTEAAQALGVRDVMGLYTAPFSAATQRTANVKRAADLVRGQIVQPGQTFSLNQVLGARTAANGFIPAAGSQSSGSNSGSGSGSGSASNSAQDVGSGSSFVATALFNAEYLAGLKDLEHHPHATVTDHFPPGMEAAVAYPDVDLKFQNDSSAPVYLWTSATDNAVTVAVLGQKAYDAVQTETSPHYALVQPKTTYASASTCVAGDGVPGFQVDVTRTLTKAGQNPIREVFHSAYAAQDKVVCGTAGSGPAGGGTGATPTDTPTGAQNSPTQHATTSSPAAPSGTPAGGGTSGTPAESTSSAGSDGSLLGGLLGAPSSRH